MQAPGLFYTNVTFKLFRFCALMFLATQAQCYLHSVWHENLFSFNLDPGQRYTLHMLCTEAGRGQEDNGLLTVGKKKTVNAAGSCFKNNVCGLLSQFLFFYNDIKV